MIVDDLYGSQQYRWFTGIVKEIADNDRVKVRIFGIHKMDDTTDVSDGDLPLAMVVYPTNSSGGGHALAPGKWVVGYFADGDDCQQPIVTGVLKGGVGASDNSSSSPSGTTASGANGQGSDTPASSNTPAAGGDQSPTATPSNLQGGDTGEKVYNFLRERLEQSGKSGGSIHIQASALTAQIMSESGGNTKATFLEAPKTSGPYKGERLPSKGIGQWHMDRLWKLEQRYGLPSSKDERPSSSGTTKPLEATLEQQLAFYFDELQTTEIRAFNKLLSSANPTDATDAIVMLGRGKPSCGPGPDGKFCVQRQTDQYQRKLKFTMEAMSKYQYQSRAGK
jgi:hypothetical protein